MTDPHNHAKLQIDTASNGRKYVVCPNCRGNKRMQEVTADMVAYNFPLFCRLCKRYTVADIVEGQAYYSECPVRLSPVTD